MRGTRLMVAASAVVIRISYFGNVRHDNQMMSEPVLMDSLVKYLNTYRGRDRALRTVGYACWFVGGLKSGEARKKFCSLASEFSSCRTILRLFDDVLMLSYNCSYGLGKQETDGVIRWLSVACHFVDQLYYPVEHIAWAADRRIINADSTSWWYSSTFLWAVSLYLSILKAIRSLAILRGKLLVLDKIGDNRSREHAKELRNCMLMEVLALIECGADFGNAIHWMPKTFLWGGKLKLWQVGLLGLVSSFIGTYRMTKG